MPFKSRRVTRTYTQKINSSPDIIFPLLCPQRETEWLDGWDYEMTYSESGIAEQDCIFKTRHNGEVDTVWIVIKHDKVKHEIEFVRMTWENLVVKISIKVTDNHNNTSDVKIEYTFTSITEKGNEFIDGNHSEKAFLELMKWWEKSMNYYISKGTKLVALHLQRHKKKKESIKSKEESTNTKEAKVNLK